MGEGSGCRAREGFEVGGEREDECTTTQGAVKIGRKFMLWGEGRMADSRSVQQWETVEKETDKRQRAG